MRLQPDELFREMEAEIARLREEVERLNSEEMFARLDREIARLRHEKAVLADLLRLHRCNADGRQTVGECVDQGHCGCSCGLLIRATEKGEPT